MYSVLLNHLKALSKSFQRRASVPPVPPTVRAAPVRARTVPAESPATLQVRAWDPADRALRSESGQSDWADSEALEGNGGGEVCDGEHSPPSGVRPAGAIGSDTDRHDLNCDLRATLTPASRGAGVRLDPLSRQGISRGASDCIFFRSRPRNARSRERGSEESCDQPEANTFPTSCSVRLLAFDHACSVILRQRSRHCIFWKSRNPRWSPPTPRRVGMKRAYMRCIVLFTLGHSCYCVR